MDLSNFELLKEDSENMHVKHPSGKVLVLNKAMLSDKAKGLVKKMACGGMVKGYENGGEIANETEVKPDKGFGKIIITGLDEGGEVGKSWIDSMEKGAAEVGQKVNNAFGDNKVKQTYESPDKTQGSVGSVKARNQIDKTYSGTQDYPNYADGGEIPANLAMPTAETPAFQGTPEQMISNAPPAPAPQAEVNPMLQSRGATEQLLNKQEQDVRGLEKAQAGAADESAQAYGDYTSKLGKLKDPMAIQEAQAASDQKFMDSYSKGELDPDRFWHNMSTGSKVLAGVSLALGGIGSSLTGGKNYAHEFLQNAINQDIEAQKNDQSKKMNLWKMNREAYGDDLKATLATQNQLQIGLQAKLAQAAAKAANPKAKFEAEQLINEIEQKKIANRQRMGMLTQGGGGASSTNPLDLATDPNIVPAEHQKQVVDEIGKAQYVTKNEELFKELFKQAEKENTIMGSTGRAFHDAPSVKALRLLAMPLLHDEVGRPNETAIKDFEDILPEVFEKKATGETNFKSLQKFIDMHKNAPMARAHGIDINNYKSTTSNPVTKLDSTTKKYYDFATAHPNLPVSQDFFAKHPELKK